MFRPSRTSTVRATVRAAEVDCQAAAARPLEPRRRSGHRWAQGPRPSSPRESAVRRPNPDRTDSAGRKTADVEAKNPRDSPGSQDTYVVFMTRLIAPNI